MKAIEISLPGGPEVLRISELPMPEPGGGQVLVKVHAAGVNRPAKKRPVPSPAVTSNPVPLGSANRVSVQSTATIPVGVAGDVEPPGRPTAHVDAPALARASVPAQSSSASSG